MKQREVFKKTELGELPRDWEIKIIENISVKVGSGKTPTGGERVYKAQGKYFIRSQNVGWGNLILKDVAFIDEETHNTFSSTTIHEYDILLNITGASIGRSAVASKRIAGGNVNQHVCIIRANELNDPEYLNHFLLSNYGQRQINAFQAGGNRQGLNFNQIKSIQIPLPPSKAEQISIAEALNNASSLISSLEKLITKKKAIKQGVMQQLLKPQKGWEVRSLGEIADVIGGGTPSTFKSEYWNGEINWFTPTEIGYSKYSFQSLRKISKSGLENCSAKILPIGSILLTSRASIGDVSILRVEACTNQGFQSLVVKKNHHNEFVYYLMIESRHLLLQNASGSTFLEVSPNKVKSLRLHVPDFEKQREIAQILSDMDAEIELLEKKLEKQKQIKQGMMQVLLTGKIRLV